MKQSSIFLPTLWLLFIIGIVLTVNMTAAPVDLNRSYTYITFQEIKNTPMNVNIIPRSGLRSRIVLARTNLGNYAKMQLASGDDLYIERIEVYNPSGCIMFEKFNLKVRSSFSLDIDTGVEKSAGADFWWHGISAGVHELVPQNGARFIAYRGFEQIGFNDMTALEYKTTRVPRSILRKQILLARTKEGRLAKLLVAAGDNLSILRLVTYNTNGTVKVDKTNFVIRSSFYCNLDTGQESSASSDFWWHGISAGVHYLEPRQGSGIYFPSYYSMVKYESLLGKEMGQAKNQKTIDFSKVATDSLYFLRSYREHPR
jgi:hypothetical protein